MALTTFLSDSQDTQARAIWKQARLLEASLGLRGVTVINNTNAETPTTGHEAWVAIQVIADCTFTTLTNGAAEGDAYTGITFTAGTVLYGYFTAITLASGKVVAHYL